MNRPPPDDADGNGAARPDRPGMPRDGHDHDQAAGDDRSPPHGALQNAAGAAAEAVLRLRARPRPVQGLHRRRIIILCAILALGLILTLAAAFDPPRLHSGGEAPMISHPGGLPQSIQDLPRSYGEIRPRPAPRPEIPAPRPEIPAPPAIAAPAPPPARPDARGDLDQEREAARKRRLRMAQQAREAGVFFALTRKGQAAPERMGGASWAMAAGGPGAMAAGAQHMPSPAEAPADRADGVPGAAMPARPGGLPPGLFADGGLRADGLLGDGGLAGFASQDAAGEQLRKTAFLQQPGPRHRLNRHRLEPLASPYLLLAGHVITAALVTGIHSDLPGLVKAQVTGPVYDSVSGDHLLIPPGAQLLGRYDSVISHGQSRVLVVWDRLILPDGSSMVLEPMPGSDAQGRAGLQDAVDFHGLRLASGVALASLLGVAAELSFGEEEDAILRALRRSVQHSTNRAGQRLTERNLAIQPTITIRPGWPVTILVTRDLLLRPWLP